MVQCIFTKREATLIREGRNDFSSPPSPKICSELQAITPSLKDAFRQTVQSNPRAIAYLWRGGSSVIPIKSDEPIASKLGNCQTSSTKERCESLIAYEKADLSGEAATIESRFLQTASCNWNDKKEEQNKEWLQYFNQHKGDFKDKSFVEILKNDLKAVSINSALSEEDIELVGTIILISRFLQTKKPSYSYKIDTPMINFFCDNRYDCNIISTRVLDFLRMANVKALDKVKIASPPDHFTLQINLSSGDLFYFNNGNLFLVASAYKIFNTAEVWQATSTIYSDISLLKSSEKTTATFSLLIDPNNIFAHVHLAIALQNQGDLSGAIAEYRKAIKLEPQNVIAHINLGNALRQQGDLSGAIVEYRKAIKFEPKNAIAHTNLGVALQNQGDLAGAIAEYRKAIKLDPKNIAAHINLALTLYNQGDLAGAIAEYRQTIKLDPKNVDAHVHLGNSLDEQGDSLEAIAEYQKAIALDPQNIIAHKNLGVTLYNQGNMRGAVAEYQEAIKLDPKNVNIHIDLGDSLYSQGDLFGAVAKYQEAIKLDPNNVNAHKALGRTLHKQKNLPGAIAEYRKAIKLDPKNVDAHVSLGKSLDEQGDSLEAIVEYQTAIAFDPKNVTAHVNLGFILYKSGDLSGAISEYRKASELDPKNKKFSLVLNHLLLQKNSFKDWILSLLWLGVRR